MCVHIIRFVLKFKCTERARYLTIQTLKRSKPNNILCGHFENQKPRAANPSRFLFARKVHLYASIDSWTSDPSVFFRLTLHPLTFEGTNVTRIVDFHLTHVAGAVEPGVNQPMKVCDWKITTWIFTPFCNKGDLYLVVEPTHLENMRKSSWIISLNRDEHKNQDI